MLLGTTVGGPDENLWKTGHQGNVGVTVDENCISADYFSKRDDVLTATPHKQSWKPTTSL